MKQLPDGTHIQREAWSALCPPPAPMLPIKPCTIVRRSVPGPKTIIVLGAYRGGTSFVARLLAELSVPMGTWRWDEAKDPHCCYQNFEDIVISAMIANKEWAAIDQEARNRDVLFTRWGFKHPSSVFHLDDLLPTFRNPHLIVVSRDPLACYQSDQSRTDNPKFTLAATRRHAADTLDCLTHPIGPTLGVCYERAHRAISETKHAIEEFVKL
jgi:hypothetical protein